MAQAVYDLLIRGGRIIDGTGNPWYRGDVAIQDDRVVEHEQLTGETPGRALRSTAGRTPQRIGDLQEVLQ